MINTYLPAALRLAQAGRSPGHCVLNRKELAKSLPKTRPEIAYDKTASIRKYL